MKEILTVAQTHSVPFIRQRRFQVILDDALALVRLQSIQLFLLCQQLHGGVQIQLFTALHVQQRFRPDLVDGFLIQLPGVKTGAVRGSHGPEPSVAGRIAQISGFGVGRSKEDALPGMRRHAMAEGSPVDIVLPGQEGTQRFNLRLPQTRQFADLHDPVALQLLRGRFILGVSEAQAVGEPISRQLCDQCAFADALGAVQHQHGVELHPGIPDPAHRRAQRFPGHGPGVGCVRGAEVIDQECVHAALAVPGRKAAEVVQNRMEGSVVHHLCDGDVVVSGGERAVIGVDVGDQLRVVRVPPEAVRMIPGDGADHLDVVRQPIEPDVPQRGIVLKDQNQILQRVFQPAGPLKGQAALPAFVFLREIELAGCGRRAAFLQQLHPDVLVRRGELQHGFHRGQLAVGCVSGGLLIPVAEQMDPDQIEGVEQLTAGGVGSVVAVKKGIVVVHDGAGGAFPGGVGVAVLIG